MHREEVSEKVFLKRSNWFEAAANFSKISRISCNFEPKGFPKSILTIYSQTIPSVKDKHIIIWNILQLSIWFANN